MNLSVSLILFLFQSFFGARAGEALAQIDFFSDSTEISSEELKSDAFFLDTHEAEENHEFEVLEKVEEEEKSESEGDSFIDSKNSNYSGLLKFFLGFEKRAFFTTKAKSNNIPLYTLFHSWKDCLA